MERSESEAVFESLNLNPQLFLNETLNAVDDLLDNAFRFFHLETSKCLDIKDADRSQYLTEGTAHIRNMIVSGLDARLDMWKQYCLRHCFRVPEGFRLPESDMPHESLASQDVPCDPDLDAQLESLRDKLTKAGKESAELDIKLQALERQSASKDQCAVLINEALQLNDRNSVQDMFQEMERIASELSTNIQKLGSRGMEDAERKRVKRVCNAHGGIPMLEHSKGLSQARLEDLQEILADLKSMSGAEN